MARSTSSAALTWTCEIGMGTLRCILLYWVSLGSAELLVKAGADVGEAVVTAMAAAKEMEAIRESLRILQQNQSSK